jgi:hypothetical protein
MPSNDPRDPGFNAGLQRTTTYTPGVSTPAPVGGGRETAVHFQGDKVPSAPPLMTPAQVRNMQQFLVNHGFAVAQDGVFGPQTKAAAQAFRTNHKGGAQWSAKNGISVHPATVAPHDTSGATPPSPGGGTPSPAATGVDASGAFNKLLQQLLGQGGNVGTPFDAKALGDAAAAPSDALATAYARQVAQNRRQSKQNQSDISSWYGLDPSDPNYKLSVLGRLKEARGRDATASSDAATNVSDIAKQLASSIGGSANDGSGMVASAGVDAAGTMSALGAASKQYADDMDPLLAAEARGSMSKEKATSQQALLALQDQLAQAQGQAKSDRASGMAGARDKNNALGQQRFANKGNLLSTLAQMAAVDPNKSALDDALTAAKVNNLNAKTVQVMSGKTGSGHVYKIDIPKAAVGIIQHLGYTQTNSNGQVMVPSNEHTRLATTIGAFLKSQHIMPGDGSFKAIGDAIFNSFVDQQGRPLQAPATWSI